MADALPGVRIKHPNHPEGLVINKTDFDPAIHELWTEEAPAADTSSSKATKASKKSAPSEPETA